MTTFKITSKISDTKNGTFATVNLAEGKFNLTLKPRRGANNRKEWDVVGSYPADKYLISYEGGSLIILPKGGEYTVGQEVTHKVFGKGVVTDVADNALVIKFAECEKMLLKSILKNFLV